MPVSALPPITFPAPGDVLPDLPSVDAVELDADVVRDDGRLVGVRADAVAEDAVAGSGDVELHSVEVAADDVAGARHRRRRSCCRARRRRPGCPLPLPRPRSPVLSVPM